ncbi:hypothetical protein [Jeotgalibacillus soli]|uniref:Uncharacterized protein n=1 Tax=Jeotgalibacillus soli TaxID=889306 RepID=A0A0C2RNY3_9BACL|nr:hypothetical protein [Jeotgalibacillus soli]KIL51970.1 hypothetical protein KP78_03400 [Jeotgalibacillus soli]
MHHKKIAAIAIIHIFTLVLILSFLNHQAINTAVNNCEQTDGNPLVKKDFLAFNWTFHCEK